MLGIRDYVEKNGFPSVILGLSGGIDSALVAGLAVDALGTDVQMCDDAICLCWYISKSDIALADNLSIRHETVPIGEAMKLIETSLASDFAGTEPGIARGKYTITTAWFLYLLMALSNKAGPMVFGHR